VDAVGIEPGPEVSAAVAARLKQQKLAVPVARPRLVTDADAARADIIVSIGCDLTNAPASIASSKKLRRWDEVPDIGKDFAGSDEAIRAKARALVEEIKKQAQAQRQPQPRR
jgi:protein-tyrosine-phosphatase